MPLAYVIAFKIRRHRTLWFGIVVVALWVGYLLRIYAWRIVLGQHGVLNGILMGLGMVDGTSDIDRACHRNIRLPAFRPESDSRGIWVIAVLLFQRLLN